MAGKVDAYRTHSTSPGDLQIHERQGDWNAGPAFEYLVQEAVAWVLIALAIPVNFCSSNK